MKKKAKVPKPPKMRPLFRTKNPASFETELDVYGLLVDEDGYDGRLPEAQRKKLLRMYRKRKPAPSRLPGLEKAVLRAAVKWEREIGGTGCCDTCSALTMAVRAYRAAGDKVGKRKVGGK